MMPTQEVVRILDALETQKRPLISSYIPWRWLDIGREARRGAQREKQGAFRGAAVAGGPAAQTPSEPGAEECSRPAHFACRGPPSGGGRLWWQRGCPGGAGPGQVRGRG